MARDAAKLDTVFAALADPTRRAILSRLAQGPARVTELAEPFNVSLPAISKHLKVLERAGLIARHVDGRIHTCRLQARPMNDAGRWINRYRALWEGRFEALERHLKQNRDSGRTNKPNARKEEGETMTSNGPSETYNLELTHTFNAPRQLVFDAWTQADQLIQWFGSQGSKTQEATVDLRAGGTWSMKHRLADGETILVHGTFREVIAPEKLVYTWSFAEPKLGEVRDSLVTVEFRERGQWADLVLRHEALPDEPTRNRHADGWAGCFEGLASHLSGHQ